MAVNSTSTTTNTFLYASLGSISAADYGHVSNTNLVLAGNDSGDLVCSTTGAGGSVSDLRAFVNGRREITGIRIDPRNLAQLNYYVSDNRYFWNSADAGDSWTRRVGLRGLQCTEYADLPGERMRVHVKYPG